MITQEKLTSFIEANPILEDVISLKPITWLNPQKKLMKEMPEFSIGMEEIIAVEKLWERFAPFFMAAFPQTIPSKGILESPLVEINAMKKVLNQQHPKIEGKLYLKCDNALPIAGSIKARGGFYEIMHYA